MAGHMVIPRFTMAISRDSSGVTRRWVTAVGPAETALPETDELFEAVIWQYGNGGAPRADPGIIGFDTPMTEQGYAAVVAEAVATMTTPGAGGLAKVVLSRPVHVRLDGPLPLAGVLRRLRAAEPDCTIFSMPVPDGTFFGATPELLVARHGARVSSHPLAGTVPAGRHGPIRRRRAARLGPLRQESGGAPLRRGRRRCRARSPLLRTLGPRRAVTGGVPVRGPPGHPDRRRPRDARECPRTGPAAPPHAGRGRNTACRSPGVHRLPRGGFHAAIGPDRSGGWTAAARANG